MSLLNSAWTWFSARLKEPSTMLGVAAVASAVMSGQMNWQNAIVGVFGAFGIVMKEGSS